jgi:hypothetical protein
LIEYEYIWRWSEERIKQRGRRSIIEESTAKTGSLFEERPSFSYPRHVK